MAFEYLTNIPLEKARNEYLQNVINRTENYLENVNESMIEGMGNSITLRQEYLESLGYTVEE